MLPRKQWNNISDNRENVCKGITASIAMVMPVEKHLAPVVRRRVFDIVVGDKAGKLKLVHVLNLSATIFALLQCGDSK